MGESRAITGLDRLPWLADDSEAPRRSSSGRGRLIAIALLILAVAALSYWLGTKSWSLFPPREAAPQYRTQRPIPLPEATVRRVAEDVSKPVMDIEPLDTAPRGKSAAPRPASRPTPEKSKVDATKAAEDSATEEKPQSSGLRDPWPVRKVEGAAGRLVHVGTFSTRRQAKRGWTALMRVNPALQRLPAMVVPVQSRRDGEVYYRLQMGTTSQAHSAALCQRLRMIGQSCIVLADAVEKKAE